MAVKTPLPSFETEAFMDDRQSINEGDTCLLVIEDDPNFRKTLYKLAREQGFQCITAERGEAGIEMAKQYKPDAILLDVMLPGMDGWSVFDRIKEDVDLRHIPIHFISAYEDLYDARSLGAVGFLNKPVTEEGVRSALSRLQKHIDRKVKKILLLERSSDSQYLQNELASDDIAVVCVKSVKDLATELHSNRYDVIVCHYSEAGELETLSSHLGHQDISPPPIIVYSEKELLDGRWKALNFGNTGVIRSVHSMERLVDECVLFMHHVQATLPEKQQNLLRAAHDYEKIFSNKKVLLVDDDIRNTFAVAKLLKRNGLDVLVAENGQEAVDILAGGADIDIVLMDIMMPVMDGIEAIRCIRQMDEHRNIPIIALTAKALISDREECLEAGANDYLAKPIDHFRLLSMMRIWLQQKITEIA